MDNKINLKSNQLVPIDVKNNDFRTLMNIYETAMFQVKDELETIKETLNVNSDYDIINNINCRVKTPDSILKKMKKDL